MGHEAESFTRTCAGFHLWPGAPDIEIIGAPLAFSKHGTTLAPPGSQSFTMVGNFPYSLTSFPDDTVS